MPYTYRLLDSGVKSISLEAYPPEAWKPMSGGANIDRTKAGDMFGVVGWLHRCVNLRMTGVSQVPWVIVKGSTDVWGSEDGKPLPMQLAFLSDFQKLIRLTAASLALVSQSFWMIERNGVKPLALKWLAPQTMTPKWDSAKGLTGYERDLGNGKKMQFAVEDIVWTWAPDPLHETKPVRSPVEAALSSAGVLYNIDTFAAAFFERGAIKATLLSVPVGTPQPEKEKLKAWWQRAFSGKAWQTEVTSAAVEPKVIGEGIESLSNESLTRERREDIATTLGIPHSLVFSDAANYATAQQDELNFLRYTIEPDCDLIASAVNGQLLARFGYSLEFRPETMDAYQVDEANRAGSLVSLTGAGVPLLPAMEILGYELTPEQLASIKQAEEEKKQQAEDMRENMAAASQGAPDAQNGPTDDTDEKAQKDMGRWERKALKALRNGKPAAVPFDSDWIDGIDANRIEHALEHATTEEEVRSAFVLAPFLGWEGYP